MSNKSSRPPRPMLQLAVPANQLEASHGQDPEYDRALHHYFWTYHNLVDLMVRVAVNEDAIIKMLIDLSAMVGWMAFLFTSNCFRSFGLIYTAQETLKEVH